MLSFLGNTLKEAAMDRNIDRQGAAVLLIGWVVALFTVWV